MPDRPLAVINRLRSFPTSNTADQIFWEPVDLGRIDWNSPPAYGAAHPDSTRYPNHKLVAIDVDDENDSRGRYWYANDRTDQDDYNYEISYPYGGDINFPRITRSYVVPRGTQPIPLGTVDVSTPFTAGTYIRNGTEADEYLRPGGVDRYLRPSLPDAVLVFQSEKPMEAPLGSVYVLQTRVYEVIPGSATNDASGLTQADNGYSIERPLGTSSFLRLTWKITLPRTVADGGIQTNYTACPISGFTGLLLVSERIQASEDTNQTSTVVRIYEGNATGAAFPSTEAVVGQKKEYPGALPPDKFVTSTIDVSRTVEIDTPENAALTDTAPSGAILSAVVVDPSDVLRGKKRLMYSTASRTTISGKRWDENLHAYVSWTSYTLTPAEASTLVAAAGTEITATPYSPSWSIITEESPPQSSITGGTAVKFYTTQPFTWPAVLIADSFSYGSITTKRNGVSTGSSQLYFDYELKPAWTGFCKAEVQIAFHATNPIISHTLIPTQSINLNPININWPGVASFNLPPCIHGEYSFSGTTGTTHPDYGYIAYAKTFRSSSLETTSGSTPISDWPDSLIIEYDVRPYKGGYLVRQVKVFKPY